MKRQNLVILIFISLVFADSITANAQESAQAGLNEVAMALEVSNLEVSNKGASQKEKVAIIRFKDAYFSSKSTSYTKRQNRKAWLEGKLSRAKSAKPLGGKFVSDKMYTARLSSAEFSRLKSSSEVQVFENRLHRPQLLSSVPVVFPNQNTSTFLGEGQSVVLIDSGVDHSHTFLNLSSTAGACFSNDNGSGNFTDSVSLCSGGNTLVGPTAGAACNSSIAGCDHGTQMAGIISGSDMSSNGVAPSAEVISVQVYTQFGEVTCPSLTGDDGPCIAATTLDIIEALKYVNNIKSTESIAAVNMSFGTVLQDQGSPIQGQCDSFEDADYVAQVASLTGSDIPLIASSGNNGSSLFMTSPACLSNTISVATTDDNDLTWVNNNVTADLDFFAPGISIDTATLPASTFGSVGGTSASAAHVSGAWAALKSKNDASSISQVEMALASTGVSVTQGAFTKPRINIDAALAQIPVGENGDDELCLPIRASNGSTAVICL